MEINWWKLARWALVFLLMAILGICSQRARGEDRNGFHAFVPLIQMGAGSSAAPVQTAIPSPPTRTAVPTATLTTTPRLNPTVIPTSTLNPTEDTTAVSKTATPAQTGPTIAPVGTKTVVPITPID